MKRLLMIPAAALLIAGCSQLTQRDRNPYDNPFYAKYLNTGSTLDAQIQRTLAAVRQNPDSARTHNDLGVLLVQKGFPKDAEREFERSVDADSHFYPAWYNLGLVRASRGEELGARHAFYRTVNYKPGHALALFQLGLIEEKRQNTGKAVKLYAKAYGINPSLLDVSVNPRVLDSKLTHLALLELYPSKHWSESMQFQGTPSSYREPVQPEAPSPQAPPQKIVPPAPPITDPSQQPTPTPPSTAT
jgi:tetratricopeptide (TPR) repeat protein